jgi:hypothetical protein
MTRQQTGDEAEAGRCLINLTENLAIARRCEEAVRVGAAEGDRPGLAAVHGPVILGGALLAGNLLGRWDEADQLASQALDTEPEGMSSVPLRLARVAPAGGHLDTATKDLTMLRTILHGTDDL